MTYQMLEQAQTNRTESKMEVVMSKLNLDQNGSQQGQNFCLDDKDVPKKNKKKRANKSPYSSTKIKARNFLSNISYRCISDKDFQNANFIVDMLSYILLHLKPFFFNYYIF